MWIFSFIVHEVTSDHGCSISENIVLPVFIVQVTCTTFISVESIIVNRYFEIVMLQIRCIIDDFSICKIFIIIFRHSITGRVLACFVKLILVKCDITLWCFILFGNTCIQGIQNLGIIIQVSIAFFIFSTLINCKKLDLTFVYFETVLCKVLVHSLWERSRTLDHQWCHIELDFL